MNPHPHGVAGARAGSTSDSAVALLRGHVPAPDAALDGWIWEGGDVLVVDRAAAAMRAHALHPERVSLALATAPDATAADLSRLVIDARVVAGRPLKVRTSDERLLESLVALGARRLVESHLVTLDRDNAETAAWLASAARPARLTERDPNDPEFCDAVWRLYRRIHGWDPVAPHAVRPDALCGDTIVAATLSSSSGELDAVVCAHAGAPAEVAYVGTLAAVVDEATTTAALIAWVLDRCGHVEVEADDGFGAHPVLVSVVRAVPGGRWASPVHYIEFA